MSKLGDKLQNLFETAAPPMGFHSTISEPASQSMLLIAGLFQLNAEEVDILTHGSVDAGLIMSQGCTAAAARQMIKAAGEVPLGVLLKEARGDKANKLASSGCDFAALHTTMPATVLHKKEKDTFLVIEPSLKAGLVRVINGLEVEGVFLNCGDSSYITVEHLLICQHFRELLNKPLMVILPSWGKQEVLNSLWQVGVEGIVIPATESIETFAGLRKAINALPRGNRHSRGETSITLPRCYDYDDRADVEEEDI